MELREQSYSDELAGQDGALNPEAEKATEDCVLTTDAAVEDDAIQSTDTPRQHLSKDELLAAIKEISEKGLDIITVEDGTINGGLGSAVAEWLEDNNINNISLHRLGIPDKFIPQGTPVQLAELCGIDSETIHRTIKAVADKNTASSK